MTHTQNEPIVRKLEERKAEAPTSLKERQSRELLVSLKAESLEGMRKRAEVTLEQPIGSRWEILCDEGAYLAGDDTAPPPLVYFAVGIGFCLITQLSRFAKITRLDVKDIRLEQKARFFMEGSALDGTMHGGGVGLETRVHVESDEPPERIRELIGMGEQTCFCHGSMREPVPSEIQATLNGEELELPDRRAEQAPVT